jgi:hypothetical protein
MLPGLTSGRYCLFPCRASFGFSSLIDGLSCPLSSGPLVPGLIGVDEWLYHQATVTFRRNAANCMNRQHHVAQGDCDPVASGNTGRLEQAPQNSNTELKRIHRHALVCPVKHGAEIHVGRKAKRRKANTLYSESRE